MRIAIIVATLLLFTSQVQSAYKCKGKDGDIKYTDAPCAANEKATIMDVEVEKSIYLINAYGKNMAALIQRKAAQGDAGAIEILEVTKKIEAVKVYSHSRIFPVYIEKCEVVSPEVTASMKAIFNTYLKKNGDLLEIGRVVASEGIRSTVIPKMNLTPDEIEESTLKKIQEVTEMLSSTSNNEVTEECNNLMSSINAYNALLDEL